MVVETQPTNRGVWVCSLMITVGAQSQPQPRRADDPIYHWAQHRISSSVLLRRLHVGMIKLSPRSSWESYSLVECILILYALEDSGLWWSHIVSWSSPANASFVHSVSAKQMPYQFFFTVMSRRHIALWIDRWLIHVNIGWHLFYLK
jgi:hypothetical protein